MNHITNERGEKVYAIGQEGSMARMRVEYPDTLSELIKRINEPGDQRDIERDLRVILNRNGVGPKDCPMLLTAAKYYAKNS